MGEGHEHGVHSHGEHRHRHKEDPNDPERRVDYDFGFRCTLCKQPVPWHMRAKDLGLKPGEEPVAGKLYRFSKCYCGFGRFVQCERSYMDMEELEAHLAEHMAH